MIASSAYGIGVIHDDSEFDEIVQSNSRIDILHDTDGGQKIRLIATASPEWCVRFVRESTANIILFQVREERDTHFGDRKLSIERMIPPEEFHLIEK